jgi:Phytanoyl-CoA dioxygenase (PhyH)
MSASAESARAAIREVDNQGYCVLRGHFPPRLVEACGEAFWPRLLAYLDGGPEPNRGPHRHYLPMPFEPPCFAPEFFFDPSVLAIVRGLMDEGIVADQWGCDVPLRGSEYQEAHVDYQRPLFPEAPTLPLPPFALVVNFGLVRIARESGPMEIAAGTHRMARTDALRAIETGDIDLQPIPLEIGDVLIRHPGALHRGTPNRTDTPRPLAGIRYVRRWYTDASREVAPLPRSTWESMTPEQQSVLRFPIGERLPSQPGCS